MRVDCKSDVARIEYSSFNYDASYVGMLASCTILCAFKNWSTKQFFVSFYICTGRHTMSRRPEEELSDYLNALPNQK